jgi:hypothetical protein
VHASPRALAEKLISLAEPATRRRSARLPTGWTGSPAVDQASGAAHRRRLGAPRGASKGYAIGTYSERYLAVQRSVVSLPLTSLESPSCSNPFQRPSRSLCFSALPAFRRQAKKIDVKSLPEKVIKAIQDRLPGAQLPSAEKETDGGKIEYEVKVRHDGKKYEVEVAEDGAIKEIESDDD